MNTDSTVESAAPVSRQDLGSTKRRLPQAQAASLDGKAPQSEQPESISTDPELAHVTSILTTTLTWGCAAFVLITICVIGALVSAQAVFQLAPADRRWRFLAELLLLLAASAAAAAVSYKFDVYAVPSTKYLLDECLKTLDRPQIKTIEGILDGLAIFAALLIARAAGEVLRPRPGPSAPVAAEAQYTSRLEDLKTRFWWANLLLYLNVGILVASVDEIRAFYSLPVTLQPTSQAWGSVVTSIASSITGSYAIAYSVYLAVVFIPVTLLLNRESSALLQEARAAKVSETTLMPYLPARPLWDQATRIVALLAPIIGNKLFAFLQTLPTF